ncbi:nitrate- and nitrite sensing domain-containing protein [Actinomadura viridis]|uniref:nitrate- and nitrite sensing domain-containing protein n=1 Tax=Actinomadura viridis TaxID=58110 RepID=UPI00367BD972
MRFRNSRLRTKITALLVSLSALWAFAAWVTLREGVNLLSVNTIDQNVSRPAVTLVTELQQERRLSMVYLGNPGLAQQNALIAQRSGTDRAVAKFRELAMSNGVYRWATPVLEKRIREMDARLKALRANRASIDARTLDRPTATKPFNAITDAAHRLYGSAGALDDESIAKDSRTLVALTRAKEILSREDALLAGALAAGRLTASEQAQFMELVGTQRFLHEEAAADLTDEDRADYLRLVGSASHVRLRALENRVYQARPGTAGRIKSEEWHTATRSVMDGLEKLVLAGGDRLVERALPMASGVILRLVLAGGLGLLAVIASIVVSITTARALVRQLERLRAAAWELAEKRLPDVVERLGHGEKVDVAAEAPPLDFGGDEIGQVSRAFNAVQETALRTAVEQAELRRGVRDVLLSLARRTQTLVHRQLSLLDTLERQPDIAPKDLQELFRLDHLATRMRRNAENLIVLSGAIPARGWRRSVPMVDVVRAAIGEVEDYTRVQVMSFGPVELTGRAVGDITHLLAELIENAVSFSPPDTVVQVGGHLVASGFAIDIEDRGLGMSDEKLADINARIADPPEFNLQSSVQLGLFVVGKLAERYGLQVSLKRSAYGGTTAVVVIPRELINDSPQGGPAKQAPSPTTTTENGLAVRQPVPVGPGGAAEPTGEMTGAALSGRNSGARSARPGQYPMPALVAVPDPAPAGAEDGDGGPSRQGAIPAAPVNLPGRDPAVSTPQPAPTPLEDPTPVPESSSTPSGLPVRVPQANLVSPLRTEESVTEEDEQEIIGRSPEEIQRIMGSYQLGSRRGRADAARSKASDTAAEGEDDQ